MAFSARCSVVDHDALGFEVNDSIFGRFTIFSVITDREQSGQGPELDGETEKVTSRVIVLHGLDGGGEDRLIFADNQVGNSGTTNRLGRGANDIGPRITDPAYSSVEIQVHNDVQCLFCSLSELFSLVPDIFAERSLHEASPQRSNGRGRQHVWSGRAFLHRGCTLGEKAGRYSCIGYYCAEAR